MSKAQEAVCTVIEASTAALTAAIADAEVNVAKVEADAAKAQTRADEAQAKADAALEEAAVVGAAGTLALNQAIAQAKQIKDEAKEEHEAALA